MTPYKRYVLTINPQFKRTIAIFLVIVIGFSGIIGFILGRATAYAKYKSEINAEQTLYIPQTEKMVAVMPVEDLEKENQPSDVIATISIEELSETFYYDCPLDNDLQDYIRDLCEQYEVPMTVIIAMIEVESSFRPSVISSSNDYGLMQINKINHEWLSEAYGITDFLDPYQNVFCGITIFSQHYKRYGDVTKALMAYNCGATGAKKLWDKGIYSTNHTDKINAAMLKYGWEGETQ